MTIQQNRTGSALPLVAPSLRPLQAQLVPEDIQKESGALNAQPVEKAVHLNNNGNHIRFQPYPLPEKKRFCRINYTLRPSSDVKRESEKSKKVARHLLILIAS